MATTFEEIIKMVNKYKWLNAHPELNKCMTCNNTMLTVVTASGSQPRPPYLDRCDPLPKRISPALPPAIEVKSQIDDKTAQLLFMRYDESHGKYLLCFCDISHCYMTGPVEICDRYEKIGDYSKALKEVFPLEEVEQAYQKRWEQRQTVEKVLKD